MLERHRVKTSFFGMDARYDLQRDMFCLSIFCAKGVGATSIGGFLVLISLLLNLCKCFL